MYLLPRLPEDILAKTKEPLISQAGLSTHPTSILISTDSFDGGLSHKAGPAEHFRLALLSKRRGK